MSTRVVPASDAKIWSDDLEAFAEATMHLGKTRSAARTLKPPAPLKEVEPPTAPEEIDPAEFLPRNRGRGHLLRSCASSLIVREQVARLEIKR